MSNETQNIKKFFSERQVHLSDIWLQSCINWCTSEALGPNYTLQEIQSKVYEQWLLLDLRDVEVPALPPNLSTKQHFTLNGNFCLQMMQIVDISKPKLWQLQKIRNSNALTRGTQQDADVVGTGKRMLQMTLTDGVQEVEAMEYRPIPCLSVNLPPGSKIRILGPVVVRRGRLMLDQQNVKVLGGEVEELLVTHASENVLARWLKLPENPTPAVIEEKLLAVEREEIDEGYVSNFKISKTQLPVAKPKPSEVSEEEELLMAQEIDMIMEAEAQCLNQSRTPDLFEEADFDPDDFESIDRRITSTQACPKPARRLSLSLDDGDDDVFDNIDIDAHLDKIDENINEIVAISKVSSLSNGNFKIKAKFKSVEEKLTVADGVYKLVIKIEDSSGDLIVRVHSDVISDFAECSPAAILSLRSNVQSKDGVAEEKVMKAITKVKHRLLVLDNVMVIKKERNDVPVITEIL